MKIALVGYGKMGKVIERIAIDRGHEIVARIDRNTSMENAKGADAAIEFTSPDSVISNIKALVNLNIPIVCGTTGWNDKYDNVCSYISGKNGSLVHASNFSLGVNLFFKLNEKLAQMMADFSDYKVSLKEIHHIEKKDAPSGTAVSLHNGLAPYYGDKKWHLGTDPVEDSIPIEAIREMDVKGTHHVVYKSEVDTISISHEAHSRDGFALGAIIAAEWIVGKQGIFTMNDVLDLS
jgi:4-hydroxy-tetrahydrodipicolinate reductase